MKDVIRRRRFRGGLAVCLMLLLVPLMALASSVDVAVVDATTPNGSVTLVPGTNGAIDIKLTVTGKQDGTATFKVYRDWTLDGGSFVGSNPQTFTVAPRSAQDASTIYTTTGAVSVTSPHVDGTYTLNVTAFDVTNTNATGAKLSVGGSASYSVTVENPVVVEPSDTAPPVLNLPPDMTIEATGPNGAVVEFTVTAEDDNDGPVAVTCAPTSGSQFPLGVTIVECEAADAAGNKATGSFTVTVVDTTPPSLTLPSDMIVYATSSNGAIVEFTATAEDVVDGDVPVTCAPASGSQFPLGTTTVSGTATDRAGNSVTGSFKVTVIYNFSGVLQPINSDGSSVFKLGSTVPVKFKLQGASSGISDASARILISKISDGVIGDEAEAVSTSAASSGNMFRYDAIPDQYIFNLGTKALSQGTYRIRIDLGDGATNTVIVSLKK